MPQIKFDYVVSFSSEDPSSPASNLLSKDIVNKKWVGQEKGASSNSVILQLEKSCQITSMHIGNYHSGFIEVLAGRSEASDQQFEVLLIASSFMSPPDSRNSVNISSVRTFTFENLAAPARDKKWDRIRVVCTQPYNRHAQFGLSFINVFSTDSSLNNTVKTSPTKQSSLLGMLKFNNSDDEDESSFKPGELFARLKKNSTLSTDTQIRNASSPHNINKDSSSLLVKTQRPVVKNELPVDKNKTNVVSPLSRKRDKLLYDDEDDEPNEKIDNLIKKDKEEKIKNSEAKKAESTSTKTKEIPKNKVPEKTPPKKESGNRASTFQSQSSADISLPSTSRNDDSSSQKNAESLKRKHAAVQTIIDKKPRVEESNTNHGTNIFRDIVFVISGYANPKRSNIRDVAISLGAKYRPDWGPNCTHLICAFPNTPKHEQVLRTSRSAIVVTAEWIIDSASEKARLPWEWFATDPKKRVARPPVNSTPRNGFSPSNNDDNNDDDDDDDDVELVPSPKKDLVIINDEEDTDDEIEKIIQKQSDSEKLLQVKKMSALMAEDSDCTDIEEENGQVVSQQMDHSNGVSDIKTEIDPFSVDTDSDSDTKVKIENASELNSLPNHFSGIKFYIDSNLNNEAFDCDKLKRYILAFDGELIESWPDPQIDVAITIDKLVGSLRPGKGKKCQFLLPTWIWKCNDKNRLYEFEKYIIK